MSEQSWIDTFADNLIGMMKEYGYTQRTLADDLGASESTISRYINKQMAPSIFMIINMSYLFGCTIDELVDFGSKIR